jgi:hypothetical protein
MPIDLNDVPLAGQTLNATRADINDNFNVISNAFAVDHVNYNAAGQGKHKKVTFPVQGATPSPIDAGDNVLYSFLYPTTNKNELYVHKQTSAGTANIPFTASILSESTPILATPGWTYLPSGILLRWDYISGNGSSIITLPTGIGGCPPFSNTIYAVFLTSVAPSASDTNDAVRLNAILNSSQFSVYFSPRTTTGAKSGTAWAFTIGS